MTRQEALSWAASSRQRRSEIRADIEGGRLGLAALLTLAPTDPLVGAVKAVVLVEALPGVGKVRARRALAAAGVALTTPFGHLGAGERQALATELTGVAVAEPPAGAAPTAGTGVTATPCCAALDSGGRTGLGRPCLGCLGGLG